MDRSEHIQAWQIWLADQGLMSFPLFGVMNGRCRCREGDQCANPGKHPKIKGWRKLDAPHPVGVLDNLGVATDRLVVVDFDNTRKIPEDLPDTFTVHTARGMHLWYWANPEHPIRNSTGWRPKVDIRSVGGLVAAPPSMTVKGTEYTYVGGDIQPCPPVIYEAQKRYVDRPKRSVTSVPDSTDPLMESLAERLALEIITAPSGERNATLFRVACRFFELADKGWLGADALRLLVDSGLHVGLGHAEVLATIESASHNVSA